MPMFGAAWKTLVLSYALGVPLGGCSTVGPVSINQARTPYNEVIQNTSEQQTLLNLVRVRFAETPLFMDVTEVDAVTTAHVEVTGTEAGLGSFQRAVGTSGPMGGSMGSIGGTASYEESPTVRYQPLLGAALVAQVNTPVSATSLVSLYNSDWPLGSIFDLVVKRFTPGFDDYHAALNALLALDRYGALVLEAKQRERPSVPEMKNARVSVSMGQLPDKNESDLLIYFRPERLRSKFRPCDRGIDSREIRNGSILGGGTEETETNHAAKNLWSRIQSLFPKKSNPLVLSVKSETGKTQSSRSVTAPLLQTRSALGMLNSITSGDNLVLFDTKEVVDHTIALTMLNNQKLEKHCHPSFYRSGDEDEPKGLGYNNVTFSKVDGLDKDMLNKRELNEETSFGDDRRLILIEITDARPSDAFVSVLHDNHWYSIQDRDLISKRNLALVAQIATIQAVPPQNPQLTPTINVGSR